MAEVQESTQLAKTEITKLPENLKTALYIDSTTWANSELTKLREDLKTALYIDCTGSDKETKVAPAVQYLCAECNDTRKKDYYVRNPRGVQITADGQKSLSSGPHKMACKVCLPDEYYADMTELSKTLGS